jgi:CubicO group peptidase (beta-lactamase class C family)
MAVSVWVLVASRTKPGRLIRHRALFSPVTYGLAVRAPKVFTPLTFLARFLALVAITALLGGLSACGATRTAIENASLFNSTGRAELEAIRAGAAGPEVPGIVVARVDASGHIETLAVGCAQFAQDGRTCRVPLTPDSVMRIASISKLVVALAVVRLVDNGVLSLDRDVSDYLGYTLRNPVFPDAPITLRTLLAHTSSVRDGEVYWAPYPQTLREMLGGQSYFDSSHSPGQYFTYSNLNYGIIGTVLECATRERFDRLLQRTLFVPLSLSAGYNWSGLETLQPDRVATLYRKQDAASVWDPSGPWVAQTDDFAHRVPQPQVRTVSGLAPPPTSYEVCSNGTLFAPQGGLRISARDLARLTHAALVDGSLVKAAEPVWRLSEAGDNGDTTHGLYRAYGAGAHREMLGTNLVGHFGDAYGLKGGLLADLRHKRAWLYFITGTAREPEPAPAPYEGLDKVEAAVLKALGLP